ncbi:MAG: hypothetical protein ACK5LL_15080 [Suipraeoptans sp.]
MTKIIKIFFLISVIFPIVMSFLIFKDKVNHENSLKTFQAGDSILFTSNEQLVYLGIIIKNDSFNKSISFKLDNDSIICSNYKALEVNKKIINIK